MRRMWPEEFSFLLDNAEEVNLHIPSAEGSTSREPVSRKALRARITQDDFEKIWHLAEARYRLNGERTGEAITLITNNPHYQKWHPSDGGSVDSVSDSGKTITMRYVTVHFLLDDVREPVEA